MANIFNKEDNNELLTRLEKLTFESKSLWGKMTVAQMILHAQKPLEVALGKLTLNKGLLGFLFGKMAKYSFLKKDGFSKNSMTVPQFKISYEPDFEKEKNELTRIVSDFGVTGPVIIANKHHPFFGKMQFGLQRNSHELKQSIRRRYIL